MCFYYSINKKNPNSLIGKGVISKTQLNKIPERTVVNGFEHPSMPIITNTKPNDIQLFQWGLVPSTVQSENDASRFLQSYNTLNAKGERLMESKIYSTPAKKQRCLVLASGFFEWQHVGKQKIPYYISLKDDELFAFAGLWDAWIDTKGSVHNSYTIVTTQANELMAEIHNTKRRMPVILPLSKAKDWIKDTFAFESDSSFLEPVNSNELKTHTIRNFLPVSTSTYTNPNLLDYYDYSRIANNSNNKNGQLSLDL
ncbi:MAG: SOS response-associated peptidase [Bacteroidales bacterium]